MKEVKILWIDDSLSWADSVQENLKIISQKYGVNFDFHNADNGERIVYQCLGTDFDMIVMDYDMEPFSGDKYIRDVRQINHLDSLPILFYSQNNSVSLEELVAGLVNVTCVFRPNLEENIKDFFLR